MSLKSAILAVMLVLAVAGCTCVSPEQAVNIAELHAGVGRLMPWAERGIRDEIKAQSAIASDATMPQAFRDEASRKVTELTGLLLETRLLPAVSEPIRDWAIAKVGTAAYAQAKLERDAMVATGGH